MIVTRTYRRKKKNVTLFLDELLPGALRNVQSFAQKIEDLTA